MERKELRHDRHTVSLLTDHMVFSPKYRRKILVEKALVVEGIIHKICKEMKIEIIDMAVNVAHVCLFIEYPPKYSVSFIAKRIKGRGSRELREEFPHLKGWAGSDLWRHPAFMARLVRDRRLWRNIYRIRRSKMQNSYMQALYFSAGFDDFIP